MTFHNQTESIIFSLDTKTHAHDGILKGMETEYLIISNRFVTRRSPSNQL